MPSSAVAACPSTAASSCHFVHILLLVLTTRPALVGAKANAADRALRKRTSELLSKGLAKRTGGDCFQKLELMPTEASPDPCERYDGNPSCCEKHRIRATLLREPGIDY